MEMLNYSPRTSYPVSVSNGLHDVVGSPLEEVRDLKLISLGSNLCLHFAIGVIDDSQKRVLESINQAMFIQIQECLIPGAQRTQRRHMRGKKLVPESCWPFQSGESQNHPEWFSEG